MHYIQPSIGVGFKILVGAPLFFPLDGQTKGGVVVGTTPHFSDEFFDHFDRQIWAINDYGYVGIDFHEDLKLVLPNGEEWDHEIGKNDACLFEKVFCFSYIHDFMVF